MTVAKTVGPLLLIVVGCASDEKISVRNAFPSAFVTSHSTGDSIREGVSQNYMGTVTDETDPAKDLEVTWYADGEVACEVATPLEDGSTACEILTPAGSTLEVMLSVRDPANAVGTDTVILDITETDAPVVTLTSPDDGASFLLGEAVSFSAVITDEEDAPSDLEVWFDSSIDGRIEVDDEPTTAGEYLGILTLSEGVHDLKLWAQDTDGKTDNDRVTITVSDVPDNPPVVEIISPASDAVLYLDTLIELSGLASDEEDDPTALSAKWSSLLDGELPLSPSVEADGSITSFTNLSEGEHVLTLSVADSAGQEASDSVVVVVGAANSAPACAITSPVDGAILETGESVIMEGTVSDPDVTADWLTASWSSDEDGLLGTSVPTTDGETSLVVGALSGNTHVVTMSVEDEVGASCTDSIIVYVSSAPTIVIDSPGAGEVFAAGATVSFEASVSDAEDGPESLDVLWESSLDGTLSDAAADASGTSTFTSSALSQGSHTLVVTVTDTVGMSASETQTLVINGAPVLSTVEITPSSGIGAADTLTCSTVASDPEGDALVVVFNWEVAGSAVGTGATLDLSTTSAAPGDTITCTALVTDTYGSTDTGSATVTIDNTPPEVVAALVLPSPAYTDTVLSVSATTSDAEGDPVTLSYAWYVNGTYVAATSTLDGATFFERDDEVYAVLSPHDGSSTGTPFTTATVTIENTEPTGPEVSIEEADCTSLSFDGRDDYVVADEVLCPSPWSEEITLETWFKLDAEAPVYHSLFTTRPFATSDGMLLNVGTSQIQYAFSGTGARNCSLPAPIPLDTWSHLAVMRSASNERVFLDGELLCELSISGSGVAWCDPGPPLFGKRADDYAGMYLEGALHDFRVSSVARYETDFTPAPDLEADADTVALWNFDEGAGTVAAEATDDWYDATIHGPIWVTDCPEGAEGGGLICIIDEESTDADGDSITYEFEWSVDGEPYEDADSTVHTGDTVPDDEVVVGEWHCIVTPSDDIDAGDDGFATTTIASDFSGWDSTETSLSEAGFIFPGEHTEDGVGLGRSVATAGDVDGDGLADILIGAPSNDDAGSSAGKAYLLLGASLTTPGTIDLADADYTFLGESISDGAGFAVASAGDVDGDGLSDILVGAHGTDSGAGTAYLWLGAYLGPTTTLSLGSSTYAFYGSDYEFAGYSVAPAGDLDGDGFADILVGSPTGGHRDGYVYVVMAADLGSSRDISLDDSAYIFQGETDYEYAGIGESVANISDMDGDGFDDLLLGGSFHGSGASIGRAYLVPTGSLPSSYTPVWITDVAHQFVGEDYSSYGSQPVSALGDLNGDGLADFVVSMPRGRADGSGVSHVFLGNATMPSITAVADSYSTLIGEASSDAMGGAIATPGDLDGDDLPEILIGAVGNDRGADVAGAAFLIFGDQLEAGGSVNVGDAAFIFTGVAEYDMAGAGVAGAGDVNGDGGPDLLIGANGVDHGRDRSGAVYLLISP